MDQFWTKKLMVSFHQLQAIWFLNLDCQLRSSILAASKLSWRKSFNKKEFWTKLRLLWHKVANLVATTSFMLSLRSISCKILKKIHDYLIKCSILIEFESNSYLIKFAQLKSIQGLETDKSNLGRGGRDLVGDQLHVLQVLWEEQHRLRWLLHHAEGLKVKRRKNFLLLLIVSLKI